MRSLLARFSSSFASLLAFAGKIFLWALLFPFTTLYRMIVWVRAMLYAYGWLKSYSTKRCMVISVGNLRVGGTGKTPMIAALIDTFLEWGFLPHELMVLSSGYGRRTRGWRMASEKDTPQTIGDEACLILSRYKHIRFCVARNYGKAMAYILRLPDPPKVVLVDDGFQNMTLKPHLSLVLTAFTHPYWKDTLLPYGRLREPPSALRRAHALILSKCPKDLSYSQKELLRKKAHRPHSLPLLFSHIDYEKPVPWSLEAKKQDQCPRCVVLVTALATTTSLRQYLKQQQYDIAYHFCFRDHFHYSLPALKRVTKRFVSLKHAKALLCTEKDFVKIHTWMKTDAQWEKFPWYYLPIHMRMQDEKKTWQKLLTHAVKDIVPLPIPPK